MTLSVPKTAPWLSALQALYPGIAIPIFPEI